MTMVIAVLLVAANAVACQPGCYSYQGICACDQVAEKAVQTFQPSNEKPPKSGMPSYQAENIKAEMPASMAGQDAKLDQEKADADVQGKKLAGLR